MKSSIYNAFKLQAKMILLIIIATAISSCGLFHPHRSYAEPSQEDQPASTYPHHGMMHGQNYQDRWNPSWTRRDTWGPGMMGPTQSRRMERHWTFMHSEIPHEYRGQANPIPFSEKNLQEGSKLFSQHCAGCHGKSGMGDGDLGKDLSPSPALLAYMVQMPMSVDEYLLWSISEGGAQFETDMPAFKDKLSRDEMWRIIAYMRAGFPADDQ